MKSGIQVLRKSVNGGLSGLLKRSLEKPPSAIVGVLKGTGEHTGDGAGFAKALGLASIGGKKPTVAEVAWFNEYGTKSIPARPFLRTAINRHHKKYTDLIASGLIMYLTGKISREKIQAKLGLTAQSDVKKEITDWTSPPNSIMTQVIKGSKLSQAKTKSLIRKSLGKTKKQMPDEEIGEATYLVNNPLIDTGQLRNSIHWQAD